MRTAGFEFRVPSFEFGVLKLKPRGGLETGWGDEVTPRQTILPAGLAAPTSTLFKQLKH